MNKFEEFTGLYPVSKTVKWELRPIGATKKTMDQAGFLERDRSRKKSYGSLKIIADEYYRDLIDEGLSTLDLNWQELADAIDDSAKSKNRSILTAAKDGKRKAVSNHLKEYLKASTGDSKLPQADKLVKYLQKMDLSEEQSEALGEFDKFTGYFQDFIKNRELLIESARGSCAYRVVDDNFLRHYDNCVKYAAVRRENPEIVMELKRSMKDYTNPDVLFSVGNYNRLVRQKDIDEYNTVVGGVFASENDVHKGLNQMLNEHHQKNPDTRRTILRKLQKQILCISKTESFTPKHYEKEDEMLVDVQNFWTDMDTKGVFREPVDVLRKGDFDKTRVFIRDAGVSTLSQKLFHDWAAIGGLLQRYKEIEFGESASKSRTKIEKWLNSKEFTLDILEKAVALGDGEDIVTFICDEMEARADNAKKAFNEIRRQGRSREERNGSVKTFVESVIRYRDFVNLFSYEPDLQLDDSLYDTLRFASDELIEGIRLYNRCRNFITKKEYSTDKFKMNFDCGHLGDGWDIAKEGEYNSYLFRRDGKYYLGVRNPEWKYKGDFTAMEDPGCTDFYEKVFYKQLQDPKKMLPKVFFSKKGIATYNPPQDILDRYKAGLHKKGESFDLDFCHELIDFYKDAISRNGDWGIFRFEFRNTSEYGTIEEFYKDVHDQGYTIRFGRIPRDAVDSLVDSGNLLLFQMYNKDYSDTKKHGGRPNLHTIYWEAAMSEDNISDVCIKLDGYARLFWRDGSIKNPVVHRKGSALVNRNGADGKPIPSEIYYELCRYRNGIIKELSPEAREYEDRIVSKTAEYDITKDRRYCEDRMFLHVPLRFNFKSDGKSKDVNRKIFDTIRSDESIKFLGIDRGERNLLYLSLVNPDGTIEWQRSLNTLVQKNVDGSERIVDYYGKLKEREIERRESRTSWKPITDIKNLKEGYVSAAVHEICRIAVENNALIIMEDLNYGFKNSRKKVERQTYQTFERMLITKLQNLVFKDRDPRSPGGVLNPYQLCGPIDSLEDIPRQCGIVFHVTASYTSKIDPTTGFINAFNLKSITNNTARSEFLGKMKSIRYNAADDVFEFEFDYRDFTTSVAMSRDRWTVCTFGDRYEYSRKDKTNHLRNQTAIIKKALDQAGVEYRNGADIRNEIVTSDAVKDVFYAFKLTLDMRVTNGDVDRIESPVRGPDGTHFISEENGSGLPVDADANGAYCIAMKGLYLAESIRESESYSLPMMENKKWLEYMGQ